jgi:hypothetical protein
VVTVWVFGWPLLSPLVAFVALARVQTLMRWLWGCKMQSLLRSGITAKNVLGVREQEPYRPFEPQYQVLQMFVAFLYMMHRFSTPASCNESGLGYVHTAYGHVKVQVGGVMLRWCAGSRIRLRAPERPREGRRAWRCLRGTSSPRRSGKAPCPSPPRRARGR